MNSSTAKIARKVARILAQESSIAKRSGDGSMRYPTNSARAIYQRLKRMISRKEISVEALKLIEKGKDEQ